MATVPAPAGLVWTLGELLASLLSSPPPPLPHLVHPARWREGGGGEEGGEGEGEEEEEEEEVKLDASSVTSTGTIHHLFWSSLLITFSWALYGVMIPMALGTTSESSSSWHISNTSRHSILLYTDLQRRVNRTKSNHCKLHM